MAPNIGRNDPCPCGSTKKFKHCYLKDPSECPLFLRDQKQKLWDEHVFKDKEVFRFFNDVINDIGSVFRIHESGHDMVAQRVQLTTTFTFIDVVASYWYEYLGKNGTQRERFEEWLKKYCLTEENHEYKNDKELQKFTATRLYSFRSSMVHFFGMSEPSEGYFIAITPNNTPEEEVERWRLGFDAKKHPTIIVKPKRLHDLMTEGGILMLNEMHKNIEDSRFDESKKWAHVEGIDRIFQKVMKEGAVKIVIPEKK